MPSHYVAGFIIITNLTALYLEGASAWHAIQDLGLFGPQLAISIVKRNIMFSQNYRYLDKKKKKKKRKKGINKVTFYLASLVP